MSLQTCIQCLHCIRCVHGVRYVPCRHVQPNNKYMQTGADKSEVATDRLQIAQGQQEYTKSSVFVLFSLLWAGLHILWIFCISPVSGKFEPFYKKGKL